MNSASPEAPPGAAPDAPPGAPPGAPAVRLLGRAQLISAVGDGSFYVTSALFFSHVLGLSPARIGLTLTLAWGTGFLLSAPLGHLSDRWGLRRGTVALSLLTALALALFVTARTLPAFVLVTVLYAVTQSGSGAVRQALLMTLADPGERVLVRARFQAMVNGGTAVGAALGGAALYADRTAAYVAVFLFDAGAFLLAAGLLTRLPLPARVRPASPASPGPPAARDTATVLRDRPYVLAAALNAVLHLYMPLLGIALPLYIADRTGAPGWLIAVLFVLNTLGVLAFQVPAARTVTGLTTAAGAVRRAGFALLASCLVFWAASLPSAPLPAALVLVLGIALQVLGEVQLAAGSWEIGFGLADPRRPGQWQGLYGGAVPVARALGPVALTALLLSWNGPGWLVLGAVFLAAALAMPPLVHHAEAARTSAPSRPEGTAEPERLATSD